MLLLQLLVNGLQLGAVYALTAAGFSLIYGSTRIFHVAHGATFTLAVYVFHACFTAQWGHWSTAVVAACAVAILFGVMLDRFVYRPIRRHDGSLFTVFVASFGVAVVTQNLIGMLFGRSFMSISTPLSRGVDVGGGVFMSPLVGVAVVVAIACFGALHLLLKRTEIGMAMRALAESSVLVRTYGMDPERVSMIVFAIGSVLTVPAAVLTGATTGVSPSIGSHVMLLSLAASIVGGVGSMYGAAFAGLLLGVAEGVAVYFFEPQWSEAVTFVVMFLFILFRPAGFFGRPATT